jgi:hypothetical protein
MGQYYKPSILKKNWKAANHPVACSLHSWDFGSGLKLMEHSYAGVGFVSAVCHLLATTYKGFPFAWVGDYADEKTCGGKQVSLYGEASELCHKNSIKALVQNLLANGDTEKQYAYAINYTKNQYCKIPKFNKKEWRVHPLPLLTCDGNGLGCGDYNLKDDRIGTWAYDCIGVTNSKKEIEGMTEISGFFKLDY